MGMLMQRHRERHTEQKPAPKKAPDAKQVEKVARRPKQGE